MREIAAVGSDFAVFAGLEPDGQVRLAFGNERRASEFIRAEWIVADPIMGGQAVVTFVVAGGPEPTVLGYANVAGFVRDDVERLTVVTTHGDEHPVPLNVRRGVSYASQERALPDAIWAFGSDDQFVEEKRLFGVSPPCRAGRECRFPPGRWERGPVSAALGAGPRAGLGPSGDRTTPTS